MEKGKLIFDFGELKGLLINDSSAAKPSPQWLPGESVHPVAAATKDADILHSYIRSILNASDVYDMMKDTEVDGVSFSSVAASCHDELSRDLVEYFACCFFEGEYAALDTFAIQCEAGNRTSPSAEASILGHVVPMSYEREFELLAELFAVAIRIDSRMDDEKEEVKFCYNPGPSLAEEPRRIDNRLLETPGTTSGHRYSDTADQSRLARALQSKYGVGAEQKPAARRAVSSSSSSSLRKETPRHANKHATTESPYVPAYELRYKDSPQISFQEEKRPAKPNVAKAAKSGAPVRQSASAGNTAPKKDNQPQPVQLKPRVHHSVVSSPSMRRRSFASHVATEGVWGRIASYGGINGPLIHINAGHGR